MMGKVPPQKGQAHPYFWGMFTQNYAMPQNKAELNNQKLRALSETAVPRRCIRYIKSQVARLDAQIQPKPGAKLTAKQKKLIDAINAVIAMPNPDDTWNTMVEKWIEDMLVLGWSTTVVKEWKEKPEHPLLLYPSDSASFQIYLDWNGSPKQRRYMQMDLQGRKTDFLPNELFVIKFDQRTSDPFGQASLAACAQEVEYLLTAMSYAGTVASQSHPKKALFLGEDADPEFVKEVRMYWNDEILGRTTMPILGGTKAPTSIELGVTSDESLFLKFQERLIIVIANAFGLDPQKVGIIAGVNRSTGDQLSDDTDEASVRPIAEAIESAFNNYFLRRYDLYDVAELKFAFTTSASDRKATAVLHQIMLQDDEITINEARQEMGYPPLAVDPELGMSPGELTLTPYRAYVQAKYGPIAGVGNVPSASDTGGMHGGNQDAKGLPDDQKTNEQKGNNGVHGASKPKDKQTNKGKELVTDQPKNN